jgi:LPS-assembly protein
MVAPLALLLSLPMLLGAEVTTGGVDLRADEIHQDLTSQQAVAEGHVVVRMGALILHCPRMDYDGKSHQMVLTGPIFAVDGKNVLIASRAEVDLDHEGVRLYQVRLVQKAGVSPEALAEAETVQQALHKGRTISVVTGDELTRLGPGHYRMRDLSLSPCDCPDPGGVCVPDWAVRAPSADVHAGEFTLLDVPTIRVHDVPILILPVLYMPLAKRRTGFLLPHLSWQHQNGFLIDEPFFLTLGDSYDLTATLGYITGAPQNGGAGPGANGVKGFRTGLEFRYAPNEATYGRLATSLLDDQNSDFVPTPNPDPTMPPSNVAYRRGLRGTLRETQDQYFAGGLGDHLDINLVTDARLTGQLTTDILYATVPATRSTASVFTRQKDFVVTGEALVFQDFYGAFGSTPSECTSINTPCTNVHRLLFGTGSPRTLAELPAIDLDLAEIPLGRSPFHFDLQASFASFLTPGAPYDVINVAQSSLSNPATPPAPGASTVYFQGRPGMLRFDALPSLAVDAPSNPYVNGSLRLSLRGDVWIFESAPVASTLTGPQLGQFGARGYPIIDLTVGTEVSRTFGEGAGRLRHTIDPIIDLRAIPFQGLAGTVAPLWLNPGAPIQDHYTGSTIGYSQPLVYDQIDAAAGLSYPGTPGSTPSIVTSPTPGGLAQGDLHVLQTLRAPGGQNVSLDLGEYFDGAGFEATYGRLAFADGPVRGSAFATYLNHASPCPPQSACNPGMAPATNGELTLRRWAEAGAQLGVSDTRGDNVVGTFSRAVAAGAPRLSSPLDALFAVPVPSDNPLWSLPDISQATLSANARVAGSINLHASVSYLFPASLVNQITAGAGYVSAQRCLAIDATAVVQPPSAGFPLGLAAFFLTWNLGEIAGGGGTGY